VLLVAAGVFAAVALSPDRNAPPGGPSTGTAPAAKALEAGIYKADFSATTNIDGGPIAGSARATPTWGPRSACGAPGCGAPASKVSGDGPLLSNIVFDEVDGSWIAVSLGQTLCDNAPVEVWNVYTLTPGADGTLSGDFSGTTSGTCSGIGTMTLTRAGD